MKRRNILYTLLLVSALTFMVACDDSEEITNNTAAGDTAGAEINVAGEAAGEAATLSDGAVVGSAVVDIIANNLSDDGSTHDEIVQKIAAFVGNLAKGVAASQR